MKNNYNNLSIDKPQFSAHKRDFKTDGRSSTFAKVLSFIILILAFLVGQKSFAQGVSCSAAVTLTVDGATLTGTVVDATIEAPTTLTICSGAITREGWYRFTATATEANVIVNSNNRQLALAVYSGACGSLTQIGCSNNNTAAGGQTESINLTGLTVTANYYVRVINSTGNNMDINSIKVITPPVNDNCSGAASLTVNPATTCTTSTSGNLQNATQSIASITCAASTSSTAYELWYRFTATTSTHVVTVAPTSAFDVVVDVRSGACNGVNIGCADAQGSSTTPESVTLSGLTPSNVYYVRVYEFTNVTTNSRPFTICITSLPPPTISSLSAASGCVGGSLTITGTNLSSATGVTIGGTTAAITNNTATSITVTIGTGTTGNVSVTTSGGTATYGTAFTINALPANPGNPTSNSPQCTSPGVTLTRTGTPPVGQTWYWQTTATGTSTANSGATYNVTTSGTYYIRSQNNTTGCWSAGSGSAAATVNSIPSVATGPSPANSAISVCYSGTGAISSVSWTTVAGATSYDIYFGAGSLPAIATSNVVTNSYTTGTLLPSTTYYWKVVSKNSCGDTLGTAATWSFTTGGAPCACASTSSNNNEYISKVVSGSFTNNTLQTNYADYTSLGSIASVMQGTATATIKVTTSNGNIGDDIHLFADWNQDGDFADVGEAITGAIPAYGSGTYNLTLTVPAAATVGNKRMRIKLTRHANASGCQNSFNNGEVEDYLINVIPTCALTITATSGKSCGSGTVTLTAVGGAGTTGYRWYEYVSSGSPVAVTPTGSFVTPTLTATKTYYVAAYNGTCESTRFPVNAFVYPAPTSSVTPDIASLCDGILELKAVGNHPAQTVTLFQEDFESASPHMVYEDYGSSANSFWFYESSPSTYIDYDTVSSGSDFAAIDVSYDFFGYANNALSMDAAITTYNYTSLNLSFRHYYEYDNNEAPDRAIVEVNTDGSNNGVWTAVQTYTSDQGTPANFATVSIDLSAYINQPNLRVRFRFYSGWNYGWNIDDIKITGVSTPSTVAWTPTTGLYTDVALTTAYAGENLATVYAYPDTAQTYTATVTNSSGCSATDTAIISGNSNVWNGSSWSTGTSPITGTEKIVFNGDFSSTGDLSGCLLQVNSGNVVINPDNTITITNQVRIKPAATFTLEDTASLLQTAGTTNANIGIIRAKRNTQPMKRLDFTYWSSPVAGQTLYNLSQATLADKYYSWNAVTQAWVTHMNGNTTMIDAKGYIVRAPQSFSTTTAVPYIARFEGVPNNGDIPILVNGNTSPLIANYKWNLIGNPYPSALDIDEFLMDVNNVPAVDGTIYLWTHNSAPSNVIPGDQTYNYTANDYATYNLSGGVATSPATPDPLNPEISNNFNDTTPTKYLASGQAFFVRGLGNLPAKFTNSMRVQDENNQFFRNSNPHKNTISSSSSSVEKNRFWLNIRNSQGAFNQALVGYIEGATNGIDRGYDGSLFGGNYVSIYSISNAQKLAIQGRALPFDVTDSVDLGIKTTIAGSFTISLDMLDGLFVNQNIYLKDNLQNVVHNLKSGPYSFAAGIGTFENRFQIVYQNSALGIPEFNPESIIIYKRDKSVVVNAGLATIDEVKVFDIQGRLLFDGQKINASETTIKSLPPTEQVLIVQVVTVEGAKVAKKIIY